MIVMIRTKLLALSSDISNWICTALTNKKRSSSHAFPASSLSVVGGHDAANDNDNNIRN